jgi:hypothetical protein
VFVKVKRVSLNQDLVGQCIETIESELNMMQLKLERNMNIEMPEPSGRDVPEEVKAERTKNLKLYTKLNELIDIYRSRVQDIKHEHSTISFENDISQNTVRKAQLHEEI